jgi:Xaa-Pro dipeptidase
MQGAVFGGGGDYPANPYVIGSGPDALLCRYHAGRRRLDANDQLTLEWAGVFRHYHACLMRTFAVGKPPPRQWAMFAAAAEALQATTAELIPGRPVGRAFAAHARVLDAAGFGEHRMNACGYSLGATFAPNWMDWPMLYAGNPEIVAEGMVFFVHMILFDSPSGLAMTLGHTVAITGGTAVPICRSPLAFVVA